MSSSLNISLNTTSSLAITSGYTALVVFTASYIFLKLIVLLFSYIALEKHCLNITRAISGYLEDISYKDKIFPNIDYTIFSKED